MKILNLVNKDTSDIKFKVSKFPDGQQNVLISPLNNLISYTLDRNDNIHPSGIQIRSRLNTFQDLELIICATKSLREFDVKNIHLYTPYLMGARSDRKFQEGGNNYLKDVICPIINSLNFESVTVLDPHSHVLEACLNNFKKEDNFELLEWSLANITKENYKDRPTQIQKISDYLNKCILVSPDAGASHKIYKLAEQIGYKGDIITCTKERDKEGKLSNINVPIGITHINKDLVIIDDICDGGRTFINIAKSIKGRHDGKIYLIVTHGIFSAGFKELQEYFNGIYCTNSYRDFYPYKSEYYPGTEFLKQLNVF